MMYSLLKREAKCRTLVVDPDPRKGASLAAIEPSLFRVSRIPILINISELRELNVELPDAAEVELRPTFIKEGDLQAKVLGYSAGKYQTPWPLRWNGKMVFIPNIINSLERAGILEKMDNYVRSGVRIIDVNRQVLQLTIGTVVNYRCLVSTFPLDVFVSKIRTRPPEIDRELRTLRSKLSFVGFYIVALLTTAPRPKTGLIYHATKASRTHTLLLVPYKELQLMYLIASYSDNYPPIPGFTEKLFSEAQRFRLLEGDVVSEFSYSYLYGALSQADTSQLLRLLKEHRVVLLGRTAMWKEMSVAEILDLTRSMLNDVLAML